MSALRKISQAIHLPGARRGSTDPTSPSSPTHGNASPRRSLAQVFHTDRDYISSTDTETDSDVDGWNEGLSKNAARRLATKQRKKEAKSRLSIESHGDSEERSLARLEEAKAKETDEMRARYGDLPLMQSQSPPTQKQNRIKIDTITADMVGHEVLFRARVHHARNMGQKLMFMLFRQQINTIQGILTEEPGVISPVMIHWAEHLRTGCVVLVKGVVQKPGFPIKTASIHDVEVKIKELKVIAKREDLVPFSVQEAELIIQDGEEKVEGRQSQISDRTRLSNRILDLRTATSQSIFRVQSGVGNLFRYQLDERGFVEIHTPKIQGAATESGASVFKLGYFGRPAFLAQSPQFAKQMAISADFERVYEIGAVFRAENSNTHRHLTEYTGLDIEMTIEEHYWECLDIVDELLKGIFKGIYTRYRREVDIIKQQFPHEDLVWLEKTPRIHFKDAVALLNNSGWLNEDGAQLDPYEDFGTRDEIRLGELIKQEYNTDYYILDKFPRAARPFYAMPDPDDDKYTNSFDIFVRGQEIISGGQRIHEPKMLEESLRSAGVDPDDVSDYMEAFRWGAPPHAGIGIGLERIVMLLLKLGNIRLSSLFHRDPKSFPAKPTVEKLRYPDSDTLHPVWYKNREQIVPVDQRVMPPLGDLIANYGDATSTSWGDERFKIWRHSDTGAAVAYVPEGKYAIIPGDPLCDPAQFYRVTSSFLKWLKAETTLRPIWVLAGSDMEEVLGERLGWKTLSPAAEERVDLEKIKLEKDAEVGRKIRKAQSEGVKITDLDPQKDIPDTIKERANKRVADWLAGRKGAQIHLSNIDLFRDEKYRRYFIAEDKEGTLCGIAVLQELAPRHGMQAKYTLDFPGAPSGTIEYITTHALSAAAAAGVKNITFGGGAAPHLTAGHHLSGTKVKLLQSTYDAIIKQFNLVRKSEFREKMGAEADPIYVAYPPRGLGSRGIRAIMKFFQED